MYAEPVALESFVSRSCVVRRGNDLSFIASADLMFLQLAQKIERKLQFLFLLSDFIPGNDNFRLFKSH